MRLQRISIVFILILSSISLSAQYISVQENYTVPELVNDILIDNPCASASNVVGGGWTFTSGSSFGAFQDNGSGFPFANGVVLTTGRAAAAPGPNDSLLSDGPTNWIGDNDLENALGVSNTINATVLEFDFLPLANKFSFDYIFSSEQYLTNPSPNQCNYTDGFAFLLKKANTSDPYQNLALVPNTTTPVLVNTVRGPGTICPEANPQWFDAFNGSNHQTNYNGQTKIMTAGASVVPNELYHIKIVIADQGNNLYDSALFLGGGSFKVTKDLGPDRLIATGNPLCPNATLLLDATETGATSYQWFKNDVALPFETSATYTVTSAGNYSVEIGLNTSCNETGEIEVEYGSGPAINNASLVQCDADFDGIGVFDLTSAAGQILSVPTNVVNMVFFTTYADAVSGVNEEIQNPTAFSSAPTTVYVRATDDNGCVGVSELALSLASVPTTPVSYSKCDTDFQDGISNFILSSEITPLLTFPSSATVTYYSSVADADSNLNPLADSFTNSVPDQQQIFAKITNGVDCGGIIPIELEVRSIDPDILETDTLSICNNQPATLSVDGTFDSYLWPDTSTGNQLVVSTSGNYNVQVTTLGCTYTKNFVVNQPQNPVYVTSDVVEFSGFDNQLTIIFDGTGDYSFSIDGTTFQQNPTFTGLAAGEYTVYIRENECGNLFGPYAVTILDYPRFFTPNADGYNDVWKIKNLEAGSTVTIFDRYGKMVKQISGTSYWDGTYLGKPLPSTDYWFVLDRIGKPALKAHFSLKR
ncbi:T9SS type B sorting domain-containing protein [Flavobacterium silvaticum]|uniref:T9SS type B sorting domain-containing protein n=1 Tax=Flavobacterium silvaticum TaxID=1852020 RepID=A0A972JGP2_9FLAO|nr:choice-of-anchor L domain-containing protein [Flavobacterium silvaticum]NMH29249.1 T9SS type B sorting domain-containing protein [Flavobacterium silvaticum]